MPRKSQQADDCERLVIRRRSLLEFAGRCQDLADQFASEAARLDIELTVGTPASEIMARSNQFIERCSQETLGNMRFEVTIEGDDDE